MSKRTGRKGKNTNNKDKQTVASADKTEEMTTFLELGTDIQDMKRAQLQKLCKQFGLKASGKVRIAKMRMMYQSVNDTGILGKKSECLSGVEPKTFRSVVRML